MIDLEHVWIITTGTGSQRTDPLNSTSYKGAAFRIWACRKLLHNVFMTEPVVWADRSVGVCHVRLPCSYRSPEWTNGLCNTCDIHTLMAEAAVLTRSSLGFSIFLEDTLTCSCARIEPTSFWLLDDRLDLLSNSHLKQSHWLWRGSFVFQQPSWRRVRW